MRKNTPLVLVSCLLFITTVLFTSYFPLTQAEKGDSQPPYLERETSKKKLSKYDRIDLAIQQEFEKTVDPNLGYVPRERLEQAFEYKEQLLRSRAALSNVEWEERGPNNVSGRTRALMFDENDPTGKTVWGGGVGGGLWKTTNIFASEPQWTAVDDLLENIAISCINADPNKPDTIYFGTGEGWFNADAIRGLGIWRTTDGGTTWTHLASTNNSTFYYVLNIAVDPATGHVYAATRDGGLQKSTNAGSTWTKVLGSGVGGGATNRAADIEIAANGDLYCSLGVMNQDGIYKSTDGGATWTKLSGGLPASGYNRIELAVAPSNSNIAYAVFQSNSTYNTLGIYKTTDAGTNWTAVANPAAYGMSNYTRGQAWYNLTIAVDPNNANNVFIGGIDLLKSTNGGTSWSQISQWYGGGGYQYVHADQHAIIFKPGSSDTILFGNDGGIYVAPNASAAMPTISYKGKNYNVTQFYAAAIHPTAYNNFFLAGAQDNGSHKFSGYGISTTVEVTGGDGGFCFIDQDEPQYQFTTYVYNNFRRSSNGGNTFSTGPTNNSGRFINPMDYDNSGDKMYAAGGSGSYLRWDDPQSGFTYATVSVPLFNSRIPSAVTVSPNTSNRVFFGTDQGRVIRVDNANTASPTATHINSSAGMPSAYINCIEVQRGDDNHILVTYTNYGINTVWETKDGGTTWTNIKGNLPDMPIRWALFNPNDSSQALLATEVGVWSTDNINGSSTIWGASNSGLANVRVDMLRIRESDNMVIAATHGRGVFTSDIFTSEKADFYTTKQVIYQGKSIQFNDASYKATSWSWNFGDGTSSTAKNPLKTYNTAGLYTVTLTINNNGSSTTKTDYIHVLPNRYAPYTVADGGSFESNQLDFASASVSGGINMWEKGAPGNYLTTLSTYNNGWKTGLTTNIVNADYQTALYTPNFNFTTAGTYTISFRMSMQVQYCNAPYAVQMQYSTDKGETWTRLGNSQSVDANGTNWYNSGPAEGCAVSASILPDQTGWANNYNNTLATYDVSFLAGSQNVAFRYVMYTQSGWAGGYNVDGFMIDDFTMNGPAYVLPVKLTDFEAKPEGSKVKLTWTTASEQNNKGFEIQKSYDGKAFNTIGFVAGKGNSLSSVNYHFYDNDIKNGKIYYRLKQVDFNGLSEVSEVKVVDFKKMTFFDIKIGPNPAVDNFTIAINTDKEEIIQMEVFDVAGKQVLKDQIHIKNGLIESKYDCKNWQKGIYFIRIKGTEEQIIKLVKY